MIETIDVKRIVPTEKQYAWTFGGVAPLARIKPGDVLDLYTEDCFAGAEARPTAARKLFWRDSKSWISLTVPGLMIWLICLSTILPGCGSLV